MILFIALALLLSKLKKRSVRVIFREWSLVPVMAMEVFFWYVQICAWTGNYRFIQYASYIQMGYILALLWPILKFSLYKDAIIGALMVVSGSALNRIVMEANGGQMPVYPTVSKLTGYFRAGAMEAAGDVRHLIMSEATRYKFLGDYIDVGFSIMSPGDLLIHGFVTLIIYSVIKELNRKG